MEALKHRSPLHGALLCPCLLGTEAFSDSRWRLTRAEIPSRIVSRAEYLELTAAEEPSGILLVASQAWAPLPKRVSRHDLWLAIDHLRTPGNIGTLMRSAAATGATGIMVFGGRDRTDLYDPTSVRASMGAIFALQHVQTTHEQFRIWRCRPEVRVFGATGEAAQDYRRMRYRSPTVLMLGKERYGLSEAQRASCDAFIKIPMCPGIDSLNVAMAGTVLLYEVFNQRNPLP